MPALSDIKSTAIRDATDALATLIRAQVALSCPNVPVDVGLPSSGVEAQHIWISAHVDDEDQRHAVSGLAAKDETFTMRVYAIVTWECDEYHEARGRCAVLTNAIHAAVRADYTLAGSVQLATVVGVEPEQASPGDGRHQAGDTISIACRAWLT